jgi:hypothetical protein
MNIIDRLGEWIYRSKCKDWELSVERLSDDALWEKTVQDNAEYMRFCKKEEKAKKSAYAGKGVVVPIIGVAGFVLAAALSGCIENTSPESTTQVGDEVELEGKVTSEDFYEGNHWDEKNDADDLLQFHIHASDGDKAINFKGEQWNTTEWREKIDVGDGIYGKFMKTDKGVYVPIEVYVKKRDA